MKRLFIMLGIACLLTACEQLQTEEPQLHVTVPKTVYKVGDTVRFTLSGNPDHMTFYSGEPGMDYTFKDRVTADGIPQLQFNSYLQTGGETNTLKLLVSRNFNGILDEAGITSASWTDITLRAKLSTGADNTGSGVIDLSDFKDDGGPVHFAFQYTGYHHATLRQPKWTIKTFNVNHALADGRTILLSAIDQIGWAAVSIKNPTVVWLTPANGQININGTIAGSVNEDNDDWVISRPFNLKSTQPDKGVVIKAIADNTLNSYSYIYTRAGSYNVTFLGTNITTKDQKNQVVQLNITVIQ